MMHLKFEMASVGD